MISGLPSPVGAYALAAQRHMYKYGSSKETLAEIAISARKWALLNENAFKKEPAAGAERKRLKLEPAAGAAENILRNSPPQTSRRQAGLRRLC